MFSLVSCQSSNITLIFIWLWLKAFNISSVLNLLRFERRDVTNVLGSSLQLINAPFVNSLFSNQFCNITNVCGNMIGVFANSFGIFTLLNSLSVNSISNRFLFILECCYVIKIFLVCRSLIIVCSYLCCMITL